MNIIRSSCDQINNCFMRSLTSVATAVVDREGYLVEANTGMRRLLALDETGSLSGTNISNYFTNPTFDDLKNIVHDSCNEPLFQGLFTLGSSPASYHTLQGAVFHRPEGFLFVAEHDVQALDQMNATVVQLNEELADTQRELVRLNRELKRREKIITEMMLTDILTELPNRRHLEQFLEQEFNRADRDGTPLALVIADIDHFKQVNDTHGHDVGDEVLVAFAKRLSDAVRTGDFVARLGGEEFVLIYPGTAMGHAMRVTERVRLAVMGQLSTSMEEEVTASFGIAEYQPGMTMHELLKRADEALYMAKEGGRNRVDIY